MPNTDMPDDTGGLPAVIARNADGAIGLTLRSAIAFIPYVGGGVSLLIEARLAARQTERIDNLFARLAEIEASRDNGGAAAGAVPPSEALLELAAAAAATTADQERPRMFANLLFLQGAGEDRAEIVRRFLIEAAATLTRYEIALLLSFSPDPSATTGGDFATELLRLHAEDPDIGDVREFSMDRLATFRLIAKSQHGEAQLTAMGRHLLSAI